MRRECIRLRLLVKAYVLSVRPVWCAFMPCHYVRLCDSGVQTERLYICCLMIMGGFASGCAV